MKPSFNARLLALEAAQHAIKPFGVLNGDVIESQGRTCERLPGEDDDAFEARARAQLGFDRLIVIVWPGHPRCTPKAAP